jgi:hypothetical protein
MKLDVEAVVVVIPEFLLFSEVWAFTFRLLANY